MTLPLHPDADLVRLHARRVRGAFEAASKATAALANTPADPDRARTLFRELLAALVVLRVEGAACAEALDLPLEEAYGARNDPTSLFVLVPDIIDIQEVPDP